MLNEVKKRVYLFNKSLIESSLVIQNFGNVSEKFDGKVVIKPSGINLNLHTYEDMSIIDINNGKNLSKLKPSVDEPTHRILYQNYKELNGIVHTHSNFATSFAQAKKPILNYGTTHSDFTKFPIPCTEPISEKRLNEDYEENTGKLIIETLERLNLRPLDIPGILVANHGVFAWGENIEIAVKNAEAIEYIANIAFNTIFINPSIKPIDTYISNLHHERKHGLESYYGQE